MAGSPTRPSGEHGTVPSPVAREVLESPEFRTLVLHRWRTAIVLSAILFVVYYGYILLVATNKSLLAMRFIGTATLGIFLGIAVIVIAWALTAAYVVWANFRHDPEVRRLRSRCHGNDSGHADSLGHPVLPADRGADAGDYVLGGDSN
jgi:uncharacterized membrane protein (DUF485 family)